MRSKEIVCLPRGMIPKRYKRHWKSEPCVQHSGSPPGVNGRKLITGQVTSRKSAIVCNFPHTFSGGHSKTDWMKAVIIVRSDRWRPSECELLEEFAWVTLCAPSFRGCQTVQLRKRNSPANVTAKTVSFRRPDRNVRH